MRNTNKIIFLFFLTMFLAGCGKTMVVNKSADNPGKEISKSPETSVENKKPINILFVGDMMFDRHIREVADKKGYDYIFEGVKDLLASQNLVIGNLEGPITDAKSVSVNTKMDEKNNFIFTFDSAVAKVLAENNIKLVNFGNNHILNQGEKGLEQTKKYLTESGVGYFGDTGEMEIESPRGDSISKVVNISGIKIGFVNYNYSVAGSFEKAIKDIGILKNTSDIIIICPHWGTEYKVGDPGQKIRSEAYELVDAGADFIIGGHPHVIQMIETYKGKKIYYSLGNFIFDQYFQKETMEGLGVQVTIKPDHTIEFREMKFEMTKRGQTIFKVEP